MTPRVFICNDNGLDFSKAQKFGNLVQLTRGPVDVFNPDRTQREIVDGLERAKFDPKVDLILLAGANLAVGFVFAWLALAGWTPTTEGDKAFFKVLIFDAKKAEYMLRTIGV